MKLPETPEEVRQFVMSDYCALKFGRDDFKPCEDDVYTMTAHDLLSAFYNWKLTQEPVPNAIELTGALKARPNDRRE